MRSKKLKSFRLIKWHKMISLKPCDGMCEHLKMLSQGYGIIDF